MIVQLPQQPTISLHTNNQPIVSQASDTVADRETLRAARTNSNSIQLLSASHLPSGVSRLRVWGDELGNCLTRFFARLANKFFNFFRSNKQDVYIEAPLSLESGQQLQNVKRKTLVLDLDETLVHSCYLDPESQEFVGCHLVPDSAVPDFLLGIPILEDLPPIEFHVYKRPYVDQFLDFVGKWYNLVVYTASLEAYASIVIDKLDAGRNILMRRFYRQHCTPATNFLSKNLTTVCDDLASVFIIDNSPTAYRDFPKNAIPIKSFIYDPTDRELIDLLPFLDALRFTRDVRSILGRRTI